MDKNAEKEKKLFALLAKKIRKISNGKKSAMSDMVRHHSFRKNFLGKEALNKHFL